MPKSKGIFSSRNEIEEIAGILKNYVRLPFTSINIPGAVMEGILGHVRGATVLRTYDFIDVVDRENKMGWQIKSTLAGTPVTWKRAKIPNSPALIDASEEGRSGRQALGDAIIQFCNEHTRKSMAKYGLSQIGHARLILRGNGDATYFERLLCSEESPNLFNSEDFTWKWSHAKKTKKKEQLERIAGSCTATLPLCLSSRRDLLLSFAVHLQENRSNHNRVPHARPKRSEGAIMGLLPAKSPTPPHSSRISKKSTAPS